MCAKDITFVKRKYNPSIKEFLLYLSENPHPNLPVIAEVNDEFYVMEYISGETLRESVAGSVFSKEKAKKLMLQLLDSVGLLHEFNIVHRDIKPENIIISDEGTLKLIDFDIARKIVNLKNRDTEILGTVGYAAPEQYGFTQTDEQSDIYAIGLIYNYMLTGKHPNQELVPGQIGKIIKKCTMIDKQRRYKSIKLLRKDIKSDLFTSYRLFDVLPGFRTRKPYKMILATFAYALFLIMYTLLLVDQAPKSVSMEAFSFYGVVFWIILYNFLFFCILTNFLSIVDRMKFPIKNKLLKKIVLLLIVYAVGVAFLFAVSGDFYESVRYNPIGVTLELYGYILYSLIQDLVFGML